MDLSTDYLGFQLPHPLMPGASPLVDDLDMVRRLEDAGAAAIVMHSLFEEQIVGEELAHVRRGQAAPASPTPRRSPTCPSRKSSPSAPTSTSSSSAASRRPSRCP